MVALAPRPAAGRDDVAHPHVRGREVCAGDAAGPIRRALADGRLADAFLLVRSVLVTYNPGSPYVPLDEWDGVTCAECGRHAGREDGFGCEACGADLCETCATQCAACSAVRCGGCLQPCDACEAPCCPDCLDPTDHRCPACQPEESDPHDDNAAAPSDRAAAPPAPV